MNSILDAAAGKKQQRGMAHVLRPEIARKCMWILRNVKRFSEFR
jgi:hypothetical protein